jgi:hypothetical protein
MSCGLMLFKARGVGRLMVGHERGIKANCFTSRLNCVKSLWLDKERERERQRAKKEEVQRCIKVLLALETRKSVGKTTKVESTECAEGKVRMH